MHYTGQVYRHPYEAATPLIEVTTGCSHNKCAFCTMYNNTAFSVSPFEHVEEDLKELKSYGREVKRINLVNGEPFVLSTPKLIELGEMIKKYFPEIEVITGYCSVKNLKNKTVEDLKKLKALGYDEWHVGVESGYEPAVIQMRKGFTMAEAHENIKKLVDAGMKWDAILMLGIPGHGMGEVNAKETAEFLNKYPPYMLSMMSTSVSPGADLEGMRNRGEFIEPTEREMLEEEILLLEQLTFEDAYFYGGHNYNIVPINAGLEHKDEIIAHMQKRLKEISPKVLDSIKPRIAMQ